MMKASDEDVSSNLLAPMNDHLWANTRGSKTPGNLKEEPFIQKSLGSLKSGRVKTDETRID